MIKYQWWWVVLCNHGPVYNREVVNTVQAVLGFLWFQGLADALVPEPSATAKWLWRQSQHQIQFRHFKLAGRPILQQLLQNSGGETQAWGTAETTGTATPPTTWYHIVINI